MAAAQPDHENLLADAGRPLLQLVQHLTDMETSFITSIDWEAQHQDVVLSLNTGPLSVAEGGRVEWRRSLCRSMFLAGRAHSADVVNEIPGSEAARESGMRSFFALPILVDDVAVGTVCGASARSIELSEHAMVSMELIATSLRQQLHTRTQLLSALARAGAATRGIEEARREVDEHKEAAQRLEVLANTDALTGIHNRRAFTARWEDELARSGRRGYPLGVLLIDIDRFKAVNDVCGHAAGDAVLIALAATLRDNSTSADIAARLGGDEFALVITHSTEQALLEVAARIRQDFACRMREAGRQGATFSVGIAVSTTTERGNLLAAADRALYVSKAHAGDCAHLAEAQVDV